jgi:hypothetical protein
LELWMVVGLILVILVVGFIFVQSKLRSNPVFLASYRREYRRSGSREQALRWAMSMFTSRSPFNRLTQTDIDRLVEIFEPHDPRVLAELFHDADKAGNVSVLTDAAVLQRFAAQVQGQEAVENVTWLDGKPVLRKSATTDYDKVAEFVSWFLANDQNVGVVRNRSTSIIFGEGHRPLVPNGTDPSSLQPNLASAEEWFKVKVFADLNQIATASKEEFRDFIDVLDEASSHTLLTAGNLASDYDLNMERFDYEREIEKIPPGIDRDQFKVNLMQDALLSAEIRILAWIYRTYYGEAYRMKEGRE